MSRVGDYTTILGEYSKCEMVKWKKEFCRKMRDLQTRSGKR